MVRKPGGLVPLQSVIWAAAASRLRAGLNECHGDGIATHLGDAADRRLLVPA